MVRKLLAVYYAVLSDLDEQVGRIVAALEETGQLENTLIIYSSDHGVAVGSHGLRGKQNMYEHTVNVPLILAGPGIPEGVQRSTQLYLRDLYPTTCELIGIQTPKSVEGRSFVAAIRDASQAIHSQVFCYFRDVQRMVRDRRWKLIHYPKIDRWQLFDLQTDPNERIDLSNDAAHAATLERMRALLREERERAGDISN